MYSMFIFEARHELCPGANGWQRKTCLFMLPEGVGAYTTNMTADHELLREQENFLSRIIYHRGVLKKNAKHFIKTGEYQTGSMNRVRDPAANTVLKDLVQLEIYQLC